MVLNINNEIFDKHVRYNDNIAKGQRSVHFRGFRDFTVTSQPSKSHKTTLWPYHNTLMTFKILDDI